jgi:cysteine desulfurase
MRTVYLDWNATTPMHPAVLEAMQRASLAAWGNPSSLHRTGREAKAVVEQARESIAALCGFSARDVLLTSGGTEANNLGVTRPFLGAAGEVARGVLITSRLEHPSVTAVAEALAARGVDVHWLPVPAGGWIDPEDVERALANAGAGPRLVALSAVNHETGVIQPVEAVSRISRRHGAELHVDAVQAAGRLAPSAWEGADSVSIAGHKMRGPKGIGALALRAGLKPRPLLRGGGQERGLRPGTVDPIAAAGFGVAAERARTGPERYAALAPLRDRVEGWLAAKGGLRNGDEPRAPHVSNVTLPGWSSDELVAALDLEGICVSAGSACAAGTPEPSAVITAMHGALRARGAMRVSLGEETTDDELKWAIEMLARVLARHPLRA